MRFWMRCRMSAGDAGGDARRLLNALLGDAVQMDEVLLFSMCVRAVKLRWVLIVSVTKFRSSELRKKDNNARIANILQRNQTMRIKQTQYIKGPKQIYFEVDRLTRKSSLQVQPKTQICKNQPPVYSCFECQLTSSPSTSRAPQNSPIVLLLLIVDQEVPQTIPVITLHINIIHTTSQTRLKGLRIPSKQPHNAPPTHRGKHRPCIMAYPFR
jgi:hypothetical protein